jgi:hypothetical protein
MDPGTRVVTPSCSWQIHINESSLDLKKVHATQVLPVNLVEYLQVADVAEETF